jgi:hypothetical protein
MAHLVMITLLDRFRSSAPMAFELKGPIRWCEHKGNYHQPVQYVLEMIIELRKKTENRMTSSDQL